MSKVVISNSMLRTLQTCSTQAWLRTKGYSTSQQENKRAMAGKAAHVANELWLQGETVDGCVAVFRQHYKGYSDRFLLDSDAYHVDNLSRILEIFFAANPLPAMPFEVVETEVQREILLADIDGTSYVVSDKPDGLIRMRDTGDLLAYELKTTGHIGENYLADYAMDSQITTHVAALREAGHDVKGVLLQVLQFNKLPNPLATTPKTGKPLSCRTSGHGYQRDCWTLHVRWERFPVLRSEAEIANWHEEALESILAYHKVLESPLDRVRQEGIFGRCGGCEFQPFCLTQRRNFDCLTLREREPGIVYSGLYNDEEPTDGRLAVLDNL